MGTDRFMLTTVDNPYNPFTQYDEWNAYDIGQGYYTNGLLARIVITSDELSENDQIKAINDAIDEIISENVSGFHVKVTAETADTVRAIP